MQAIPTPHECKLAVAFGQVSAIVKEAEADIDTLESAMYGDNNGNLGVIRKQDADRVSIHDLRAAIENLSTFLKRAYIILALVLIPIFAHAFGVPTQNTIPIIEGIIRSLSGVGLK